MVMRYWIALFIVAAAAVVLAYNYGIFYSQTSIVCFRQGCLNVSLAMTPYEKSRGLMQVERLDQDKGMLFVFGQDGVYDFWMGDVKIPLELQRCFH